MGQTPRQTHVLLTNLIVSMKTNINTSKVLFQRDIRYIVPDFQRRYVWTLENQWEPLWEDIRNTADEYMEQLTRNNGDQLEAERNTKPHFLGAVVIQQIATIVKEIDRRDVIDGQQRLTTLQLLLNAAQWVCEKRNMRGAAKRLQKLVTNDRNLVSKDEDALKLWPTIADRESFRHTVSNKSLVKNFQNSLIVQAYEYFQLQICEWACNDATQEIARMEALETTVTALLNLVVIELDPNEDPHVIFETMNARGTPLLESDLIKNYVVSKAEGNSATIWGKLGDDWWLEEIQQGRLRRTRLDVLFDYWLEMKTAKEVAAGRVFKSFREYSAERPVADIMAEVSGDLERFRDYQDGTKRTPAEEVFYYRTSVMKIDAFTPVLLYLLAAQDAMRSRALASLDSYLVRRMVCRMSTKDYYRLVMDLLRELQDYRLDQADEVIERFLTKQKAESRKWPNDEDVAHAFKTLQLYRLLTRGKLRLILEGIENQFRKNLMVDDNVCPKKLTIEHVLPRRWEVNWPLPDRNKSEEEVRKTREILVHTIGNLTLVNRKLNSSMSNAAWEKKREILLAHCTIKITSDLATNLTYQDWNEETIVIRSEELAKVFVKEWPGPELA